MFFFSNNILTSSVHNLNYLTYFEKRKAWTDFATIIEFEKYINM